MELVLWVAAVVARRAQRNLWEALKLLCCGTRNEAGSIEEGKCISCEHSCYNMLLCETVSVDRNSRFLSLTKMTQLESGSATVRYVVTVDS